MTPSPTPDSSSAPRGLPTLLTVLLALAAALWLAASPAQAASDANAELLELQRERAEARQAANCPASRRAETVGVAARRAVRPTEALVTVPGTRMLPL